MHQYYHHLLLEKIRNRKNFGHLMIHTKNPREREGAWRGREKKEEKEEKEWEKGNVIFILIYLIIKTFPTIFQCIILPSFFLLSLPLFLFSPICLHAQLLINRNF